VGGQFYVEIVSCCRWTCHESIKITVNPAQMVRTVVLHLVLVCVGPSCPVRDGRSAGLGGGAPREHPPWSAAEAGRPKQGALACVCLESCCHARGGSLAWAPQDGGGWAGMMARWYARGRRVHVIYIFGGKTVPGIVLG
jgi:hypothetical protein